MHFTGNTNFSNGTVRPKDRTRSLEARIRIKTIVRVRSAEDSDTPIRGRVTDCIQCDSDDSIFVHDAVYSDFDCVYPQDAPVRRIFEEQVEPSLSKLFEKKSFSFIAYGQTGSGKTYTLIGWPRLNGLISMSIVRLLDIIKDSNDQAISIYMSCTELIGTHIKDLFVDETETQRPIRMRDSLSMSFASNSVALKINTVDDCMRNLNRIVQRRLTKPNAKNLVSSRSHCSLCIFISRLNVKLGDKFIFDQETATKFQSKLTFMDLAGSEKFSTEQSFESAKRTSNINFELDGLRRAIAACSKAKMSPSFGVFDPIPHLIKDTLTGQTETTMMFCISPYESDLGESIFTLDFGAMASQMRVHRLDKNSAHRLLREERAERAKKSMKRNSVLQRVKTTHKEAKTINTKYAIGLRQRIAEMYKKHETKNEEPFSTDRSEDSTDRNDGALVQCNDNRTEREPGISLKSRLKMEDSISQGGDVNNTMGNIKHLEMKSVKQCEDKTLDSLLNDIRDIAVNRIHESTLTADYSFLISVSHCSLHLIAGFVPTVEAQGDIDCKQNTSNSSEGDVSSLEM
ncbi:hypothetical protein ACOME3_007173 [Neoechinorhynchus agilis]